MRRFFPVLASILAMSLVASAEENNWNPSTPSLGTFEDLPRDLESTTAILYLTKDCKVVGLVAPEPQDMSAYLPSVRAIQKHWFNRAKRYRPNPTDSCTNAFQNMTFEKATNLTDSGKPAVCDPTMDADISDIAATTCQIDSSIVSTAIWLDDEFDPIAIVTGPTVANSVRVAIPARYLGRKKLSATSPCSPTTPSPCLAPKTGKIKTINGQNVCVCSL